MDHDKGRNQLRRLSEEKNAGRKRTSGKALERKGKKFMPLIRERGMNFFLKKKNHAPILSKKMAFFDEN